MKNCSFIKVLSLLAFVNIFLPVSGLKAQSPCTGFKTFTQGGWGSTPNGNNPGTILDNGFSSAFPGGLTIGCTNKLKLTSAAAVRAFLPSGTSARALPAGTLLNPTKASYSNVLAGQLVALTLSAGFDLAQPGFAPSSTNLKDMVIAAGPFMGKTVQQIIDIANQRIGGCSSTYSLSDLNTAIDNINRNYDNGTSNNGFLVCPLKTSCSTQAVSCYGGSNGSMSVSVTGGLAPFTYQWSSNSGNVATANGLSAGTYTVTVSDAVGQTSTSTCTVSQPTEVIVTPTHENVMCNAGNDGSVAISFDGGTAPYTVSFNGGAATAATSPANYSSLVAGSYSWVVKDANGCTKSGTEIVTEPTVLTAADNHSNVKCNGGSDGSVEVSFSGGVAPYVVSFNGGEGAIQTSPATYSGLSVGTYSWIVKDANGCMQSGSETIEEPTALVASDNHSDAKCNGGSDGSVTVSFGGGTAPYTINFNGGDAAAQTSPASYNNLSAGSYTWVVTDANGCTQSGTETVGEPTALVASDDHSNVNCNGGTDGSVSVSFSGGTAPYTVSFNGGAATAQTSPVSYNSLSAGSYSWTVTDANGCTKSGSAIVEEPTALIATDNHTDNACYGGTNGSVSVSFSGGTAPYSVSFNGGAASAQTSPAAYSNLSAGSYSWVVTDANGCTQSGTETVGEPTEVTATENHTNVSCNGGANGSVTLTFEGGTGPYSVSFVNNIPASTPQLEEGDVLMNTEYGIPKGYIFNDNEILFNNSQETLSTDVDSDIPTITTHVIIPTLPGLVSQTSPASYNNLAAGSYSWTIVDANGCIKTGSVEITQPQALVATSIHNNITCARGSNGAVVISFAGGVTPYSMNFNGSISSPSSSPDKYLNLSAGTYDWTITDANGCTQSGSETVIEPNSMQVSLSTTPDTRCGDAICDGSATVSVTSGGTAPYTYTWTINGTVAANQTSSTASALCPNSSVAVAIVDAKGCTGSSAIDTIRCINGPVAAPDSTNTPPNTPVTSTLKNNDTPNPQCPNNMWSLVSNPSHGTVSVQSNGTYTYTPAPGFTGLDTFYYKICDCNSMCDTSYAIIYISGTIQCVPLKTFSQGGWGATNNPAKVYMYANFATAFPNGITLGCGSKLIKFTTPQAITNWLPAGTNNYLLPNGTLTNPSNATFNSNLVGQLLAATLSVGFDAGDTAFANGANVLGSMYYQRAPFVGMTVNQIIAEANKLIGGCATSFTNAQLGTALAAINLNYDGLGVDNGNLTCTATQPTTQGGRIAQVNTASMFPNPASITTNVVIEGNAGETATISLYDLSGRLLKSQKVVLNNAKSTVSLIVSDIQNQTCVVKITKGGQTTTSKLVVKH